MYEFTTPKTKKYKKLIYGFGIRIRQKFSIVQEFSDLIDAQMYDTYKGIYLPLTLHFQLSRLTSFFEAETYFRMQQLPVNFFRRTKRPAFDDKTVLEGMD